MKVRTFFTACLMVAMLTACNNSGKIKADVDTTLNDVKNSGVVDSLKAKGDRLADSVKSKGVVAVDSSKVKGARIMRNVGEALKKLSTKLDSTQ